MTLMRTFLITYKPIKKYGNNPTRIAKIHIPNPCGEIGGDAKRALNSFISTYGNLKRNEIIEIQEIDTNTDKPIGEPIVPDNESSIIPEKK